MQEENKDQKLEKVSVEEQQRDFNKVATNWDEKPRRVQLATAVATAIKDNIPLDSTMKALEFGCGTGLVTFNLVNRLAHVTAIDSAAEMLEVVKQKAVAADIDNITTSLNGSAIPELQDNHYDLIFSSMVLHHLPDIYAVLAEFRKALKSGGIVALADLDVEDGSFHSDPCGVVHCGIDRLWLNEQLLDLGFNHVQQTTAHTIVKYRSNGEQRYPVFLIWAQKL
ncbi:MAG: hypothetical protein B6I36_02010 [Desulfobacteraceae bacterium 4572_35.1]|nr:MAG: hypothetical protein B6I36_02010 [Desulfobacteraceae bacterium 4572_35.1]